MKSWGAKVNDRAIKDVLVRTVVEAQGLKATELANLFLDDLSPEEARAVRHREDLDLPRLMRELVEDGELVEVEYVLPTMNYRAKSFFLPRNSEVVVISNSHAQKIV